MPLYRAYILDEYGHVTGAVNFDAADDEEARERAKQLDGHRVELWRQVRLRGADDPHGPWEKSERPS